MAAITATKMTGPASRVITRTTLGSSDTFTFNSSSSPILLLDNVTAGSLTVTIDGAGATTQIVSGIGTIDLTSGYSTGAIGAGVCVAIPLVSISSYLSGVIAVTGGTGIKATLLEMS